MKLPILLASTLLGCCCAQLASGANLFESDWASGKINEFLPNGTESTFASGLSEPSGLAFNAAGNLFVAAEGSGNVYEFSPSGVRSTFATGLGQPYGIAFGSNGNLYVSDEFPFKIYSITPQGTVSVFASTGFLEPEGLAVNSSGNLFMADFNRIDMFTPSGNESTFASAETGAADLAFGPSGNLYASNSQNQIYEYASSGSTESLVGTVPGQSASLAFDGNGNLFVGNRGATEIGAGSIYEFSSSGTRSLFASGLSDPQGGLAFAPAPEPSTVLLMIIGAAGLCLGGRRRWLFPAE